MLGQRGLRKDWTLWREWRELGHDEGMRKGGEGGKCVEGGWREELTYIYFTFYLTGVKADQLCSFYDYRKTLGWWPPHYERDLKEFYLIEPAVDYANSALWQCLKNMWVAMESAPAKFEWLKSRSPITGDMIVCCVIVCVVCA